MNCFKNNIQISFSTYCQTQFGENVYIVGNSSELGNWTPILGLKLQTTPKEYPIWYSKTPIIIEKLSCIQFKICVLGKNSQIIRWQNLAHNRTICLKKSCSIFISDGEKQTEIDDDDTETEVSQQGAQLIKSRLTQIKQQQNEQDLQDVESQLDKTDQFNDLCTTTSLRDSTQNMQKENTESFIFCESLKFLNNQSQNEEKQQVLKDNGIKKNQKENFC